MRLDLSSDSFNDQEIVALSGAHAMGRCHTGECHEKVLYFVSWTVS